MKNIQRLLIIIGGVILLGAAVILGVIWFSSDNSEAPETIPPTQNEELDPVNSFPEPSNVPSGSVEIIQTPPLPLDQTQRERILKDDFQEILETEFSERYLLVEEVAQVNEYAAANWSDQNAGGVVFLVFTNEGWRLLDIGGGYPYPQDLADESGMSIETAEQLLDGVFPEWREFQE